MMQQKQFGIYLNIKNNRAMRISTPYWIPSGNDWVFLTPDVNATILKIRELAKSKSITSEPDQICWGNWSEITRDN